MRRGRTSPRTSRAWRALVALPAVASLSACGFFPFSRTSREGTEVLVAAPKPAPVDSAFGDCGAEGSRPDKALNRLKNRVDEGDYLAVPWTVVARLPWPRAVGYRPRSTWARSERRAVARYEGAAVQVAGWLDGLKLEVPEPPNCYARAAADRDYHLWLTRTATDARKRSIVVEITPRVRARHAGWTDERLTALVDARVPVRVSGWLMLDQYHPELVGGNRATLWEVHPVMQLEWQRPDGGWVALDSMAPDRTAKP